MIRTQFKKIFMDESKLIKYQEYAFLIAVILLPFNLLHQNMRILLFGQMCNLYAVYPVFVGMMFYFLQAFLFKRTVAAKRVAIYFFVVVGWQLISLVHGLITFPYWDAVKISKFGTLTMLLNKLSYLGIQLDFDGIGFVWLNTKLLYTVFSDAFFTMGVSVWLYSLFKFNIQRGLRLFRRGLCIGAVICVAYSVIEVAYLAGSIQAAAFLKQINRCIYDIAVMNDWYPPELCVGRIRSVTTEPSYLGIYLSVALPVIGSYLFEKVRIKYILLLGCLVGLLLGTHSKTAIALCLLQAGFMVLFLWNRKRSVCFDLKAQKKQLKKIILGMGLLAGLAILILNYPKEYAVEYEFLGYEKEANLYTIKITNVGSKDWNAVDDIKIMRLWSTEMFRNYQSVRLEEAVLKTGQSISIQIPVHDRPAKAKYVVLDLVYNGIYFADRNNRNLMIDLDTGKWINKEPEMSDKIKLYIDRNILGIADLQAGSNSARYGVMAADMKIGYENLLFGVGANDLKQAYMKSHFPDFAYKSAEVRMWVKQSEQAGSLKMVYPVLNEYTNTFAKHGVIGLLLFCLPLLYVFFRLIKYRQNIAALNPLSMSIYIAFVGMCVSLCSNTYSIMYCFWFTLAMVFLVNRELHDDDI